jgi:thioredoxin reductase (NADPH)
MDNSQSSPSQKPILPEKFSQLFPKLSKAQIARLSAIGNKRSAEAGETLVSQGDSQGRFFVILSGKLEVALSADAGAQRIAQLAEGQFSGEINLLSNRRSLAQITMCEAGEILEIERSGLQEVINTDSELSDLLIRAFALRRLEFISHGWGDAVVIGSVHCPGALRIREFLSRNGHPYTYLGMETDQETQEILERFSVGGEDIPVLICRGEIVLRNPTNQQVAECLGFNEEVNAEDIRDLIIVGAGPAGLSSAVYAASEGLSVLVIEKDAPGGQAGSSSKIENYLGFPIGVSGQELAGLAYTQAQKFGAEILVAQQAMRLACDKKPYSILLDGGQHVRSRSIIIATGAHYRPLPVENITRYTGIGVYHEATSLEAQLCRHEDVIVIGGGNSAGQAAVYLSEIARHVHVLIRTASLADSMSRYLIQRVEANPAITLHPNTEVVGLAGEGSLECVHWRNNKTGEKESHSIRHIFVMTGATPNAEWLEGCLVQDAQGFIKTGRDLSSENLTESTWPLSRAPFLFETSLPGIFAVGDIRSYSVKRVASAVGEGAIAVSFVHQVLHEV